MKKLTLLGLLFILSACGSKGVTLRNLEDYIDHDDYLFIDIRNPEEAYVDGYLEGFTFLPLNGYLFEEGILRPPSIGGFRYSDILDETRLRTYLDETKTIVIICRTGSRTAYFEAVLNAMGYDVVNLGGIHQYSGSLLRFPDEN